MSTVEDRLTDALAARVQRETVEPEALAEHVEEVCDAVDGGVTPIGRRLAGIGDPWPLPWPACSSSAPPPAS